MAANRILVGDDETQIRSLVRDVLRSAGYEIEITKDGGELLQRYAPGAYSLVILDIILERTSGMEVVTRLRDRGDDVPIILMSGSPRDPARVEPFAFAYHVDLLRKPFGARELRAAVERALGSLEAG